MGGAAAATFVLSVVVVTYMPRVAPSVLLYAPFVSTAVVVAGGSLVARKFSAASFTAGFWVVGGVFCLFLLGDLTALGYALLALAIVWVATALVAGLTRFLAKLSAGSASNLGKLEEEFDRRARAADDRARLEREEEERKAAEAVAKFSGEVPVAKDEGASVKWYCPLCGGRVEFEEARCPSCGAELREKDHRIT
ncbi:MAG: hypothetical protein Kow0069_22340 [Promethearchaeota archaeon]